MVENLVIKGEWFLPSNTSERFHGTLTFLSYNKITLELYGSFNEFTFIPELKNEEIILGITSNSEQVTLYKCQMIEDGGGTQIVGQESGKPTIIYLIKYALIGLHALSEESLRFNSISAEIFNLDEWVGISGFDKKKSVINENYKISIEYNKPEPVIFEIDNEAKGQFVFIAKYSSKAHYKKQIQITQKVEFCTTFQNVKSIDALIQYILRFQNFITLALYKGTYPLSITLKYEENIVNTRKHIKSVKLYTSLINSNTNEIPIFHFRMLFNYDSLKDDFPQIIRKWFAKYELFEPAFNLVFEQFYKGEQFSSNTFLNLAQAAETFHSRVDNHTKIPANQYKKMKEDILQVVPPEYHSWLNDQFNFGNNLNLHTRLSELTEKYSNPTLDRILGDKQEFVLKVKNSRNYYTHYSNSLMKKALKGGNLYYLSERLKILLVCCFLIEIGISKDKVSSFMTNKQWTLFNHITN